MQQIHWTRRLSSSSRQLVLLAPSSPAARKGFKEVQRDSRRHRDLLAEMQTLRASVHLKDGYITAGEVTGGRHKLPVDEGSWHLLVLDQERRVCGCVRYQEHPSSTSFSKLGISHSALAHCPQWGEKLQSAVESELAFARRLGLPYVELGGWALLEQIRGTNEALRMALAMYALAQILGGVVGISPVARRNGSASILKRLGGRPLEYRDSELPSYHDPKYSCEIELLRFYSWAPNPRYAPFIAEIKAELPAIPVIAGGVAEPAGLAHDQARRDLLMLARLSAFHAVGSEAGAGGVQTP